MKGSKAKPLSLSDISYPPHLPVPASSGAALSSGELHPGAVSHNPGPETGGLSRPRTHRKCWASAE